MRSASDSIYTAPEAWVAKGAGQQGNLFLTGRAGTGKTTLLRRFLAESNEKAIVLAPTGVAAMQAGGQTIHSFFNFPPRLIEPADIRRLRTVRVAKAIDTLIIDEISMVRADMLDAIDRSLKLNRGSKRPFGGVRMILSGDLYQLPPVVTGDEGAILNERFGGAYFFHAPAFREGEFALLALKHVFRQDDPKFLAMLNALRSGKLTPMDETVLKDLVRGRTAIDASRTHVVLTPNNANAARINQARLDELPGRAHVFAAAIDGEFDAKSYPADAALTLKEGARVMLVRNDSEGRWVNGSIGTVEGFSKSAVAVSIEGRVYDVEPAAWEKFRYDFDTGAKKIDRKIIGTFKQIPLRLAYAVTIHKAQGLTLEKVYIDFDRGLFAHGQAYVALSRARTLEGLELSRALTQRDLVIDRSAFAFGKLDTLEDTPAYLLAKFKREDGAMF